MSKKQSLNVPCVSWGYGYVLSENAVDRIVGKILTLIEVMGLSDTQEKSAKDLARQAITEVFGDSGIYITPERHNEIRKEYYAKKVGNTELPISAV